MAGSEIEQLIGDGLDRYGRGDLEGALREWERALVIDPENPQAASYVDYVRMNYELLTAEVQGRVPDAAVPFGISDDDEEYSIEIVAGEVQLRGQGAQAAPTFMDPADEGWIFDEEPIARPSLGSFDEATHEFDPQRTVSAGHVGLDDAAEIVVETIELPDPWAIAKPGDPDDLGDPDDAGYPADPRKLAVRSVPEDPDDPADSGEEEFAPQTTEGFGARQDIATPQAFAQQPTALRARDLGFIKATATTVAPVIPEAATPTQPRRSTEVSSELKVTLRTPRTPVESAAEPADDLISSLPSPRPHHSLLVTLPGLGSATHEPAPAAASLAEARSLTRQHPPVTRPPAISEEMPALGSSATGDFDLKTLQRANPAGAHAMVGAADRHVLTSKLEVLRDVDVPLMSAPTRDLGIRPPSGLAARVQAALEEAGGDGEDEHREGTVTDAVLPFDPIDARSAQILADLGEAPPSNEPKEDRTKRRIVALFERATEWSRAGELDKAVAAIDLALSEDPNSALAQKLIQRNRDTVQAVFQAFLGDLERQPQLARPLRELARAPISPRAAFLLSRVDGMLTLDEILDVSGMPRLEAYRHLCQLYLRGILR